MPFFINICRTWNALEYKQLMYAPLLGKEAISEISERR
jgi:hypothetical protein